MGVEASSLGERSCSAFLFLTCRGPSDVVRRAECAFFFLRLGLPRIASAPIRFRFCRNRLSCATPRVVSGRPVNGDGRAVPHFLT